MSRRATIWGSALLVVAAIVYGVFRAIRLAWLADDSFISFRYAWNLVHGNGLVYNAGESGLEPARAGWFSPAPCSPLRWRHGPTA